MTGSFASHAVRETAAGGALPFLPAGRLPPHHDRGSMIIHCGGQQRISSRRRALGQGLLLVSVLWAALAGPAAAGDALFPFEPGERLTYVLKWEVVPAGEAVLEVLPMKRIDGEAVFHFALTAKSFPIIDPFFKVRDRIEAFTDTRMTRSLLYKKDQHEGRTRRQVVVNFDWDRREARFANFDKQRKPIPVADGTFDPLAAFYFSRLFDLETHRLIERPVSDGKRCVIGKLRVIKRENITIGNRVYDTFLVMPEMTHIRGVFEKSKEAGIKLWVSADHRRIPIRIESRVAVGRFVGELVSDSAADETSEAMGIPKRQSAGVP
jgi:hypothetical protein